MIIKDRPCRWQRKFLSPTSRAWWICWWRLFWGCRSSYRRCFSWRKFFRFSSPCPPYLASYKYYLSGSRPLTWCCRSSWSSAWLSGACWLPSFGWIFWRIPTRVLMRSGHVTWNGQISKKGLFCWKWVGNILIWYNVWLK